MKLTNGIVFGSREALQKLMAERLPVKTSYWLAKMARKLNDQLEVIEAVRIGLIKQYGTQDEGEQNVSVKAGSENYARFVADFNELMSQEVELDIEKVKLPEDGLTIAPEVLFALDPFIEL